MTTTIIVCDTCRYSVEEKTTTTKDGSEKTGGELLAEEIEKHAQGVAGLEVLENSTQQQILHKPW